MLQDATMDSCLRALCMTFVLASFTRRSGAVETVIRCEPCDAAARLLCKPLPKDCAERVREPGCGCCMTCALSFGQPCGVYTGRCGSGLSCQHQPGETKPLQALLDGRGICANATNKRIAVRPTPPVNELPAEIQETQEDDRNSTDSGLQRFYSTHRAAAPLRPLLPPYMTSAKSEAVRQEQQKRAQRFKMEALPGPLITDQQNFSLEEPEYGPCRREIESIFSSLKITDILSPRGFRIPNCDKKGFYKKKQCRPSKGQKRGFCWCVDKYGQPLPGFDGKERGDTQHYNSGSQ
ncbi:insulin-like growth factor-binding protein 3 [Cynoglossus semilaevis]|uniref:Insulin like growth factor binding protein 3 n=1 Tax=Cynoglossus semilaevis TaxID=244447 RepID=A0A3P8VRF0_CYNSE|nr:insulin-like growth factor-binding protein 3 [Cynoglossus semilaevis]